MENAEAPNGCNENEVIISVKAASVHAIDAEICSGYGHTLRRILQRLYSNKKVKLFAKCVHYAHLNVF